MKNPRPLHLTPNGPAVPVSHRYAVALLIATICLGAFGCSIKKLAVNKVGDALAKGGSTWENDDDIELVGEALPFSLKLVESLLAQSPRHRGLLRVACQGFTTYTYAYVEPEAYLATGVDFHTAEQIRVRSRRLYLRALDYGMRGLEVSHAGFREQLVSDPESAAAALSKQSEVPLIYWTAASLGLAISASKDSASMLARVPEAEALIDRALELNEAWDDGVLHEFRISLASASAGPRDFDQVQRHYERALELSGGRRASLFVVYAESVSIPTQDLGTFRSLLDRALAIDPDAQVETRLPTLLAQRRARWLLEHVDDHFLEVEGGST